MRATPTTLEGVFVLEPEVYSDDRGWFYESWSSQDFNQAVGVQADFVQDNHSRSRQGVMRGLHYQNPNPQGKLVRCISGAVFDVAVDLRKSSKTVGGWVGIELSAENRRQMWVPPGFAHGFVSLSDAEVAYKVTGYYSPSDDRTIRWDDAALGIEWPEGEFLVAPKDAAGMSFEEAPLFD